MKMDRQPRFIVDTGKKNPDGSPDLSNAVRLGPELEATVAKAFAQDDRRELEVPPTIKHGTAGRVAYELRNAAILSERAQRRNPSAIGKERDGQRLRKVELRQALLLKAQQALVEGMRKKDPLLPLDISTYDDLPVERVKGFLEVWTSVTEKSFLNGTETEKVKDISGNLVEYPIADVIDACHEPLRELDRESKQT